VAGYSGTPLPQKLGIKDGSRVLLADAPEGFACSLGAERRYGLSQGLVDNRVCAIDETCSGLRFVVRLSDRR